MNEQGLLKTIQLFRHAITLKMERAENKRADLSKNIMDRQYYAGERDAYKWALDEAAEIVTSFGGKL